MTAFGVYTGHTDELLDEDATIVFDRGTTTVNVWQVSSGQMVCTQTLIRNTQEARAFALSDQVIAPHTMTLFLDEPFVAEVGRVTR